jgi:hypothetical protein
VNATADGWRVHVLRPYPGCDQVVFGRCAARSPAFAGNAAAGGAAVIIGSAAGESEEAVVPRARGELLERAGRTPLVREGGRRPGAPVGGSVRRADRGRPSALWSPACRESAVWVRSVRHDSHLSG